MTLDPSALPQEQNERFALPFRVPLRVLVAWNPLDTNSGDNEALEFAAWLGRSLPISVRVVSTLLRPWPASIGVLGKKYKKWHKKESQACASAVENALKQVELPRKYWAKEFSTLADGQNEATMLSDEAERFDADIILVGSNAAASKGRFLAGSAADALMHSSPTTLGLAPRKVKLSKKGINRVNFAFVDERCNESSPGLMFASELATYLEVPLRIIAFSPTGIGEVTLSKGGDIATELIDDWHEQALGMLDLARDRVIAAHESLEVITEVGAGKGWANAVDALKWKKGDLICMSSQPLGTLERVFVGSSANEFLRHVPVPVMISPATTP
ncbi:universal stress protein [Corynebacterium breve]|uniref:Universal stress protein n=1 Tax=Corynebacterium breve TaxID=3049799 RepID=A0ABY8VH54_9CORY|nr:universal stress protein [Corynebacterium breve]WIM67593.1 universal stress protein [Corynebacterium breve]